MNLGFGRKILKNFQAETKRGPVKKVSIIGVKRENLAGVGEELRGAKLEFRGSEESEGSFRKAISFARLEQRNGGQAKGYIKKFKLCK